MAKKKMVTIFTVMTIKFGMKKINIGPHKGKKIFAIMDKRAVGWFPVLETAKKCLEKNWGDIYECGAYPWAVIEEVPFGLYPPTNEWWYAWDKKKKAYQPVIKPKEYVKVTNFAIG